MAQLVKTVQGLAIASVKTTQGLAIASAKTIMGVDNTGGGIAAWTLVQTKTGTSDGGGVASVTMDSAITAGNTITVLAKCEDDEALTAFSENGGAGVVLTPRNQSDLDFVGGYKLSATGGTGVTFTWSGTPLFSRVIVQEWAHGGTATFVTSSDGGGDTNPTTATIETGDVTNSGTERLNVAGAGLYTGTAPTTPRIGGTAGNNFTTVSDTHSWWNSVALAGGANDDADCQYSVDGKWTMYLMCFAAN